MKIALIHPKTVYECEIPELDRYANQWYRDIFSRVFNLNLLRIAALTPSEHEVTLLDENRQEIDFDEGFDLVGVTAMTYQANRAYQIAQEFKNRGCHTIFGGIHATMMPQEASRFFNSVCVGEVENVWGQFLKDLSEGKPKGLYSGAFADLKKTPSPAFEKVAQLIPKNFDPGLSFFPVMTTRGCPRGCDYCSATYLFEKLYRKKEIDEVIAEIRQIKTIARDLKIPQFHIEFGDDNFIIDVKRTKKLLTQLIDENVTYTVSIDIAASDDQELLELLASSGCKIVSIGLESLDGEVLGELGKWKRSQLKKVEKNINAYFKYGINPACNFMVGSDHSTLGMFHHIREFVDRFPVLFNLLFFTPFPGTPYRKVLETENRLRNDLSWTHYNLFNVVYEPKNFSREALYEAFMGLRFDYDHLGQYLRCTAHSNRMNQYREKRVQKELPIFQ